MQNTQNSIVSVFVSKSVSEIDILKVNDMVNVKFLLFALHNKNML